jgi:Acyltransferase family
LSADVFASAALAANIALLLRSGYFDVESARKPLLHLWSLGIEEQFHLVWPPILMLAARFRIRPLGVAAAIGLASFVLNVALIDENPVATFYLPFTRAWELLAGGALACAWDRIPQDRSASNWRAGLGMALIATAAALLDPHRAFPGWWAVLPVAGGALLLSAPSAWGVRHLLASPPLVRIGLISYPLYLWHWPLLVFAAIIKFAPLTLLESELVVLASVLLAWATYRFVEIPIRFGRPSRLGLAGLCATMGMIAVAGGIVVHHGGLASRLPPEICDMAEIRPQSAKWRVHSCLLDLDQESAFADDCVDRDRRPLVLVWGGFHRGGADARPAQGAGNPRFRRRATDLLVLHPGPQCRHRRDPELSGDQRQGSCAGAPDSARYRAAARIFRATSRSRRRDRHRAEAGNRRARGRARSGAGLDTRPAQ